MFLTVFTPSYNRANKLSNIYESLKIQKFKDFEWLIGDDGSTDNTEEIVKQFIIDSPDLNIRYFKIEHGGKHIVYNKAYDEAKGEFFMHIDSDDSLYDENSLQIFYNEWQRLSPKEKEEICAISGYYIDQNNNILGRHFKKRTVFDLKMYEDIVFRKKYELNNTTIDKTEMLRKEYFPEIKDNLSYFPEWIIWMRLYVKHNYKTLLIPDVLYRYNVNNFDSVSVNTRKTKAQFYEALYQLNEWYPNFGKKYPKFFEKVAYTYVSESKKWYSNEVKYDLFTFEPAKNLVKQAENGKVKIKILGIKISYKKKLKHSL